MATIRTNDTPSTNELAPRSITDPVELQIIDIIIRRGGAWWMPDPLTMEGLPGSSRSFVWRDIVNNQRLAPSIAGVAPRLTSESATRNFLSFGYGGALTPTENGALETSAGIDVWGGSPNVSMFAIVRTPAPGGAAGASPGGAIFGNMQSQTEAFSPASNKTWTGLQMGYGAGVNVAEPRFCVNGDTIYGDIPGSRNDRDGKYKVLGGIFDFAAQTQEIRINAASLFKGTTVTGDPAVNAALPTAAGARRIRVGATGAPGTGTLTNTARMDMAHLIVLGSAATNTERDLIESYLLSKYPTT